jgi:hypothetical protein
LITIGVAT